MLAVILKILSILGIVLLVLSGIFLVLLLVILFMPVMYCFDGEKTEEVLTVDFKARWLFGFLRAGYAYPEPGRFIVKLLWFTLYDSGAEDKQENNKTRRKNVAAKKKKDYEIQSEAAQLETKMPQTDYELMKSAENTPDNALNQSSEGMKNTNTMTNSADTADSVNTDSDTMQDSGPQNEPENTSKTLLEKLFSKVEKIKYTISKICDKIRHILEEYEFYRDLFEDKESKSLFSHVCRRIGKVFRHIRPRDLKADIVFGTGSPDTTGYAYGIYGMFSPKLGEDICITPDFEKQILMGRIHAAGHITIFTVLINAIAVLLDKRLWIFAERVKTHNGSHKSVKNNVGLK